jgi:hypothetical protein
LLEDIINWKETKEVEDISHNGNIHQCVTTKGWKLCILWKDSSTSWEPLKDVIESYPIQVADFEISHGLQYQPAFCWGVRDALK